MLPEPIVTCTYGWGRVLTLHHDNLNLNGTSYALSELVHVRPFYRHMMGIPSVRIELYFKKKKITVRGIAVVGEAQKIVAYLTQQLSETDKISVARLTKAALEQIPSTDQEENCALVSIQEERVPWYATGVMSTPETLAASQLVLEGYNPRLPGADARLRERAQALTTPIEMPHWQRMREEQRERRLKRLRAERSMREHGFDVEKLALHLRDGGLSEVQVPIPLFPGERAYYRVEATLCGEPLNGTTKRYGYQAKDHGALVLTSERLIYLGRKSQIILGYAHLLHVSRLRKAVAFMAEHWSNREIFEVSRPLECTMYLEYILQRFQQHHTPHQQGVEDRDTRLRSHYVISACSIAEERAMIPIEDIDTVQFAHSDWDLPGTPGAIGETALNVSVTAIAVDVSEQEY